MLLGRIDGQEAEHGGEEIVGRYRAFFDRGAVLIGAADDLAAAQAAADQAVCSNVE